MAVTIKYFGLLVDVTQKKEEQFLLDVNKTTVADLKSKIETIYTDLQKANYSIAVNQSMSRLDVLLKDQDVIAFLPPFAGG